MIVSGGSSTAGTGGTAFFGAGNSAGSNNGPTTTVRGGGAASGSGGPTFIEGGYSTNGNGGHTMVTGGDGHATTGTGGNVYVRGGNAATKGNVFIGDTNTVSLNIGGPGVTTTFHGLLAVPGVAPLGTIIAWDSSRSGASTVAEINAMGWAVCDGTTGTVRFLCTFCVLFCGHLMLNSTGIVVGCLAGDHVHAQLEQWQRV